MHVLVISNIEWSDENAFGNTISNWFEGMNGVRFSSIYCRSDLPNNKVCQRYYSITPQSILRHFISKERIGRQFTLDASCVVPAVNRKSKERRFIQFLHRHNIKFLNALTDFLFWTRRWSNHQFRNFILEDKPDIVFSFVKKTAIGNLLAKEIKKLVPECKLVGFVADDVYGIAGKAARQRIREMITKADAIYGASEMLCSAYQNLFHREMKTLYKGCCFKFVTSQKELNTLTIVYAGNLHYGRTDTLVLLALAIKAFNQKSERKFVLHIYSGSQLLPRFVPILNDGVNSIFWGKKEYQEIQEKLAEAPIVLHVESFDKEWEKVVRFSFSTKIIDCLESGSVLLAIGPSEIASIDAVKHIPGAFVAENSNAIPAVLEKICQCDLDANAKKIHNYAIENHSIANVQRNLLNDFNSLVLRGK